MQRVGRYDKVIAFSEERFCQPLCQVPLIEPRLRHLLRGKFDHTLRKVLPINGTALFIQPGRQPSASKAKVQNNSFRLSHNTLIDVSEHCSVSGKGIGVLFLGNPHKLIIVLCPEIKALLIQHNCPSLRIPSTDKFLDIRSEYRPDAYIQSGRCFHVISRYIGTPFALPINEQEPRSESFSERALCKDQSRSISYSMMSPE